MMLLLFVRLFGLNNRPEQSDFNSSNLDLERRCSTALKPGILDEEIQKVGKVYLLEKRFFL